MTSRPTVKNPMLFARGLAVFVGMLDQPDVIFGRDDVANVTSLEVGVGPQDLETCNELVEPIGVESAKMVLCANEIHQPEGVIPMESNGLGHALLTSRRPTPRKD